MLAAERGAAPLTIEAYGRDLADFAAFLGKQPIDRAGEADLRGYLARLEATGMSPRTAARRLSALRQFHKFLMSDGIRKDDPTAGLDGPRQGRRLPGGKHQEAAWGLTAPAAPAGLVPVDPVMGLTLPGP